MALTETLALSASTVTAPLQVTATLTVSNSGATAVSVVGAQPFATAQSGMGTQSCAVNVGQVNITAGMNNVVPASGTLVLTFGITAMAPIATTYPTNPFGTGPAGNTITPLIPLAMPNQQVYTIGCLVYGNDGSVSSPSTTTLTVNGPVVG